MEYPLVMPLVRQGVRMVQLKLRTYPDPILRAVCPALREVTDAELARARDMLELMYTLEGAGLAGPQVGWESRVLTVDVERSMEGERIFVNPRIISMEGEQTDEEGCLSLPGIRVPVTRARQMALVAYTIKGERVEFEVQDLTARAWQHEIDHLNGIMLIDHLDAVTLTSLRQELKRLERAAEEHGGD